MSSRLLLSAGAAAAALMVLITANAASAQGLSWRPASGSSTGPDVVGAGESAGSLPLVCRLANLGTTIPGEITNSGCVAATTDGPVTSVTYDVAVGAKSYEWKSLAIGVPVPSGAFPAGREGAVPIYVCRGNFLGTTHIGRLRRDGCLISHAGKQEIVEKFDVLTVLESRSAQAGGRTLDRRGGGSGKADCTNAQASVKSLSPANDQMVAVTILGAPGAKILSIRQDECVAGLGGALAPDGNIKSELIAELRAERLDGGDGRVYTIELQCADGSKGKVQVEVPKSPGGKSVDQGPKYDSTGTEAITSECKPLKSPTPPPPASSSPLPSPTPKSPTPPPPASSSPLPSPTPKSPTPPPPASSSPVPPPQPSAPAPPASPVTTSSSSTPSTDNCSAAEATLKMLWPATRGMVEIKLKGVDKYTITRVTQDECVAGLNASDQAPDGILSNDAKKVQLRAERDDKGDGRVYTIAFSTSSCTGAVKVMVPKEQGAISTDSGTSHDSLASVADASCGSKTKGPETSNNAPTNCSAAKASVDILWPLNHRTTPVSIVGVTGAVITAVLQDECVAGTEAADMAPDAIVALDGRSVQLRAEAAPKGDGRVYHIRFTAGSCNGEVTVAAPLDRRSAAGDGGAQYDSRASSTAGTNCQ